MRFLLGEKMSELFAVFYNGAHGDTLLIRTDNIDVLYELREAFTTLSQPENTEIRFSQIGIEGIQGIEDVIMTNRSTFIDTRIKQKAICWEQSPAYWYNDEGLMAGMIDAAQEGKACHQYFGDRITITVSFREH